MSADKDRGIRRQKQKRAKDMKRAARDAAGQTAAAGTGSKAEPARKPAATGAAA